jgi:adenylylsulfate kinase
MHHADSRPLLTVFWSNDMTNTTHNGFTVWLTGMSGSGKTTLAKYLAGRFNALGKPVEVLEGNEVSDLFARGLGESKEERNLLVKRLGYAARAITKAGGVGIVPALSPYRDARDQIRREIGRFVEVFVDCPVDVLISRDTTGKYKKAMTGEIPNFVGITDPYEPPQNPEVIVRTDSEHVADAAERIFQSLLDLGYLRNDDVHLLAGKKMAKGKGKKVKHETPPKSIKGVPVKAAPAKVVAAPVAAKPATVKAAPVKAPTKAAQSARMPVKASGSKARPAARAAKTVKAAPKKKAK